VQLLRGGAHFAILDGYMIDNLVSHSAIEIYRVHVTRMGNASGDRLASLIVNIYLYCVIVFIFCESITRVVKIFNRALSC
jgi:hypothetical protein